jgi:AcrR family transcriptional regulator
MKQQLRSEETRTRILEAAQECISERGYDATSVAEICECAAVSKGAFYHHFPSKHAAFLALFSHWLASLDESLATAGSGGDSVPEGILRMAGVLPQVFQAGRGRLPIFLEFWSRASRDPVVWQAIIAPYSHYTGLFRDLMARGIAEGSLRPVDPEVSARVILALAVGLVLQGLLEPEGADWGEVAQKGLCLLFDGLAERGETQPQMNADGRR